MKRGELFFLARGHVSVTVSLASGPPSAWLLFGRDGFRGDGGH